MLPEIDLRNRTVIIVGQGIASGAKMLGAVASVRDNGARKVVVAAPAGSGEAATEALLRSRQPRAWPSPEPWS